MARKERGIFRMILRDFLASIQPQFARPKLIGEDFHGTKYYEVAPRKGSSKKPSRYFEPVNKEDFTQELPAEWESWLRYRRREPPTKDEVQKNYEMILLKRKNAAEIEKTYEVKEEIKYLAPKTNSHIPGGYPVYEEYKEFGIDYKNKKK